MRCENALINKAQRNTLYNKIRMFLARIVNQQATREVKVKKKRNAIKATTYAN